MARYREALCRMCRREGEKLFLKGDRCYTEKCAAERREFPPGQHGRRRTKTTEYGVQLREKQKVKNTYGLLEGQFRKLFGMAESKKGVTGELLLQFLERRLDNAVYRMGFAANRRQGRQLITHGFFKVNGRSVTIPSFLLKEGDVVEANDAGKKLKPITDSLSKAVHRGIPAWIELDSQNFKAKVGHLPAREEIGTVTQEQLIVELYSK